jgi:putative methionine-R-sulfoxide reductase with GAF domain
VTGVQTCALPISADSVSNHVGFYLNPKGKIKIGNYQQHDIVHYVEKEKINTEMINILEEIAWKK